MKSINRATVVVLLFSACSSDQSNVEGQFAAGRNSVLTTDDLFGDISLIFGATDGTVERDELMGWIQYVKFGRQNDMYVFDGQAGELRKYDLSGRLVWKMGEPGDAPGQFTWPNGMAWTPEGILFANINGRRFDLVTEDGEFKKSYSSEEYGLPVMTMVGTLSDGSIVAAVLRKGSLSAHVQIYDHETLALESEFVVDKTGDFEMGEGNASSLPVFVFDDMIAIGSYTEYEISLFSRSGELLDEKYEDEPVVKPVYWKTEGGRGTGVHVMGFVHGPIRLDEDRFVVIHRQSLDQFDPDEDARSQLGKIRYVRRYDVYDNDWQLLGSVSTEDLASMGITGSLIHSDGSSAYFRTTTPEPAILKVRLN